MLLAEHTPAILSGLETIRKGIREFRLFITERISAQLIPPLNQVLNKGFIRKNIQSLHKLFAEAAACEGMSGGNTTMVQFRTRHVVLHINETRESVQLLIINAEAGLPIAVCNDYEGSPRTDR